MRATLLLALAFLASLCQAAQISGLVVHVTDGDTITVLDTNNVQHKVRLAGIDAPEKAQAYGRRSRESLAELTTNRSVIVDTNKQDRYGRLVGKVLVDGQDVNIEQVRRGMAWVYRQYARELSDDDRQSYDHAESDARKFQKGLWADKSPMPPWEFRKSERRL